MSKSKTNNAKEKLPAVGLAIGEGTVIIEVGPNARRYHVHKALLVHYSEYFKNALQDQCKEGHEGVVRIEDVEPVAFNIFVHWLYTQQLPDTLDGSAWSLIMERDENIGQDVLARYQAYSFSHKFLAFDFRRAVNASIIDYIRFMELNSEELLPSIQWAFENIPSDRPCLQLLVNDFVRCWQEEADQGGDIRAQKKFPRAFLLRIMRRRCEKNSMSEKRKRELECYLEHASEDEGSLANLST